MIPQNKENITPTTSKPRKRSASKERPDDELNESESNFKRQKPSGSTNECSNQNKKEIIFEGKNLLDLKGTTMVRYARCVARTLWSDPDSLWYNRIVDPGQKTKNAMARSPFRGSKNMMKIQLLKDAVKEKFQIKSHEWEENWIIIKDAVNEIGQRRKFYKGTRPKTQYTYVHVSELPGYRRR